jgi:hypothetical protein
LPRTTTSGGAFVEGDHRRAAGQRLDHHHPERLLPADRHQQPARPGEEGALAGPGHLTEEADRLAVDVRGDLALEEGALTRLDDPGEDEPAARQPRRLDRPVGALGRRHPADPEEVVVLLLAQRPVRHRDRVRDHGERLQPGRRGGELSTADADQRCLVAVAGVEGRGLRGERTVQGVDQRRPQAVGHRQRGEAAVVVDDVEALAIFAGVDPIEGAGDVVGLIQGALDLVGVGGAEQRDDVGARFGARGAEERHLVAAADERLGQRADHRLDSAVAGRGDRDPRRRQHRDPQRTRRRRPGRPGPRDGRARGARVLRRKGSGHRSCLHRNSSKVPLKGGTRGAERSAGPGANALPTVTHRTG